MNLRFLTASVFAATVGLVSTSALLPASATDRNAEPARSFLLTQERPSGGPMGLEGPDDLPQGEGALPGRHNRPDFAEIAANLGTTEAELKAALGLPENPPELDENGRPTSPPPRPDFSAGAAALGVSEEVLMSEFGVLERMAGRERRIIAAAERLGVPEAELRNALGFPQTLPEFDEDGNLIGEFELPGRPNWSEAAGKLTTITITAQELREAMRPGSGRGGRRDR